MRVYINIILLFVSLSVFTQNIYFSQICGFKNIDNCPDSLSGISWGLNGDWLLNGNLPKNFEKTWTNYDCIVIHDPVKDENGVLIEFGEIILVENKTREP